MAICQRLKSFSVHSCTLSATRVFLLLEIMVENVNLMACGVETQQFVKVSFATHHERSYGISEPKF